MTMTDKGAPSPRERILKILDPFEVAAFVDAIGLGRWDALAGARTIDDCREILKDIGDKEIRDMIDFGVPLAKLVRMGEWEDAHVFHWGDGLHFGHGRESYRNRRRRCPHRNRNRLSSLAQAPASATFTLGGRLPLPRLQLGPSRAQLRRRRSDDSML